MSAGPAPPASLRRLRRRDVRLVPVAAAAWVAAGVTTLHPSAAAPAAIALWAATGVAILVASRAVQPRRTAWALTAVAVAVAAACASHVAAAAPARDATAGLEIAGGRALTLDVTAVGKIERSGDLWRFDAALHHARLGESKRGGADFGPIGVPVLVRLADPPSSLDLGATIRLTGTAWPADPGERAVLVVDATGAPAVLEPASGVLAVASALRRGLVAATADLPPPGGGLIAGLAVGDTSAVDPTLDAAMKASSLSHLTAVSGANCALVVALAFGAAALCRARRGVRVAVGLAALVAFVILVSPEPSVVRAAAMAAIAMLGVLLGRPGAGLSLLTTAVVALLVVDPWLSNSLGFALSAAATGALLIGAGPLADGLARWMPQPLALAISVPLAAQLVCGPLIVLISPQLSVYGVIANLIAAPAAPAGTVLGLAACVTAGIPLLGAGLAAHAWVPAAWIAATATTFASLPGSVVHWPGGLWGLALLACAGAAVAALIVRAPGRVRTLAVLVLASLAGAGLGAGPVSDALSGARVPATWAIVACDVGQGDALLIRSAARIALIDTGPDPALLADCLHAAGVDRVDLLVLTHFDLDHRGGIDAVRGRVGTMLHGPTDGPGDIALLASLQRAGAHVVTAARGMAGSLGDSRWRVLWPRPDTPPGNDASVVVEWRGGGVPTSLYLGDLSAEGQRAMKRDATLTAGYPVVKVAHHGSADQDVDLYGALRPAIAVVSVGENDYGHPRAEILDALGGLGSRIARTDREGMLAIWADADGLRLWHERAPAAVSPDG